MKLHDTPWILSVQMDVDPLQEALFQEVYETEHIPALMGVPGVRSVRRVRREEHLSITLGGETHVLSFPGEPTFTAFYEIDSPDVVRGQGWARAVDTGRWASHVRPFTSNRRHTIHSTISWRRGG